MRRQGSESPGNRGREPGRIGDGIQERKGREVVEKTAGSERQMAGKWERRSGREVERNGREVGEERAGSGRGKGGKWEF